MPIQIYNSQTPIENSKWCVETLPIAEAYDNDDVWHRLEQMQLFNIVQEILDSVPDPDACFVHVIRSLEERSGLWLAFDVADDALPAKAMFLFTDLLNAQYESWLFAENIARTTN